MATYQYQCECGEVIERDFPIAERKQRVKCPKCGKMADRAFLSCPAAICRYSLIERNLGNPRASRGKGRR